MARSATMAFSHLLFPSLPFSSLLSPSLPFSQDGDMARSATMAKKKEKEKGAATAGGKDGKGK